MPLPRSKLPGADIGAEADSLVDRSEAAAREQQAQLETAPAASVEARYSAALAVALDGKRDQAERLENRLEVLATQQDEALRQVQAQKPGRFSLPATRARWQDQVNQAQAISARLHDRLDHVRELREGMGLHSPKLEEMAARKVRLQEPDLAAEFDDWSTAERGHRALQRQHARNARRGAAGTGLGLSLERRPER